MHYAVFGAWDKMGCFLSANFFGWRGLDLDGDMVGSRSRPLKAFYSSVHIFFRLHVALMIDDLVCFNASIRWSTNITLPLLRFCFFALAPLRLDTLMSSPPSKAWGFKVVA